MAEVTDPSVLAQLNATGDAYYKQLAQTQGQGYADLVKATADGKRAVPSGMALRTPYGQRLIQDVYQLDPTADDVNLPTRVSARKAFMVGTQGKAALAAATALEHSSNLDDAITKLGNVNPGFGLTHIVNGVRNSVRDASGDTNVTQFQNTVTPLIDELERAYTGTGGTVSAIEDLRKGINLSQSTDQQRKAVQTFSTLLAGKLEEQNKAYNLAMGTVGQTAPGISDRAQQLMKAYQSPDYISKGLAGVLPASADNGAPPSDTPTAPPSAGGPPPAAPAAPTAPAAPVAPSQGPGGAQIVQTARDEVSPEDKKFADTLETAVNSGLIKSQQDAADFAKANGRPADANYLKSVQDVLDYRAKGGNGHIDVVTPTNVAPAKPADAAGAFGTGLADSVTLGALPKIASVADAGLAKLRGDNRSFGDIYGQALASNNQTVDQAETDHPLAALAGNTAGFITGDAALGAIAKGTGALSKVPAALRPIVGDAAYGGLYGAGSSDSLDDVPGHALSGAALGTGGGVLGRGLVKGAAAVASPVANDAVRRLTAAGVTLTPGQILGAGGGIAGRAVKGIEDRAAGFPVIGDIINSARRGGVEDFNKSAINDALKPIGETVDDVGHGAIGEAQQKVSDAYSTALSKMTATPDATFTNDLQKVAQNVQGLSESKRDDFTRIMDTDLQPYLSGKAQLGGDDLQAIKQGLDKRIANLRGQGSSPQDRDLADHLDDVKGAVMSLAGRTDPAAAADFQKADQAYAMLSRVNNAASKSKDGVFTPNQFRQAVTKRGYGTTTNNLASGSALMQQLSTDASTVLPSSVPDSGTAGRAALGLVAGRLTGGAALGGAAGGYEGGTTGALTGAVLGSALFSKPGLRATQGLLAGSRGKALNTLGDILRANANLGGAVGTPLLLQSLSNKGN